MRFDIRPLCYRELEFAELIAEAGAGDGRFLFRLRDHWLEGSESLGFRPSAQGRESHRLKVYKSSTRRP